MAKTSFSGSSSYATADDLIRRYDPRSLGDLLSDSGTRMGIGTIQSDPRVTSLLAQTSGMIESACLAGKRYHPSDLSSLTGNSKEFLIGLICDLSMWVILNRRPDRKGAIPPQCTFALDTLEALRRGERIFGFEETAEAGKFVESKRKDRESLLSGQAFRYFGRLT